MTRTRFVKTMLLSALPLGLLLIAIFCMGADSVMLVTAEEAALPGVRGAVKELDDGPTIDIRSPENGATLTGPFRLYVEVVKKPDGSDIDMGSLSVTYLKVINIDITGRVRKYISGTKLDVPDAEFPNGSHRALISIKDVDGKVSSKLFSLTVTEPE
jgi:hypothetical protein